MRYFLFIFFSIVSLSVSAVDTLRIGVISDTHFLSPKLMKEGSAVDDYISAGGKNVLVVPEVLDKVLGHFDSLNNLDVLLVSGDMTKDGEKESHLDFVAKLEALRAKGTKIFVVPGNHDISMPNSLAYIGGGTMKTDNVSPEEFVSIYKNFGYGAAMKRDDTSLSYVAELDSKTWLLTLDVARYKEYTSHSISSGQLNPQTEQWALAILDEARAKGISVIGMMHWGLVEHIAYQSTYFGEYLVQDWERLASLLADRGMKVMFTGHFHANDIAMHTSDAGNTIYDIETATLSTYPFAYRVIDYYGEGMDIKSQNVVSTPSYPNLEADEKGRLTQLAFGLSLNKLKNMDSDLPEVLRVSIADVLANIFVQHVKGDEVMDDELRSMATMIATLLDSDMDLENLELDTPPADNNLTITF